MEEKLSQEVLKMLDEIDREVYKKLKDEENKEVLEMFEEIEEEGRLYRLINY